MNKTLLLYDFGPGVTAFSTTRRGGVSEGAYASFNVNAYCGDHASHVSANRLQLCKHLGISPDHLIIPHQTHQTQVRVIDEAFFQQTADERQASLEGIDAVLTDVPQTCIGVSTADCIPILVYDNEHHAAAAIHAGWRGTVARIAQVAVEAMSRSYASRPSALHAIIGPGIGLDSFEVGDEVWQAFADADFPMSKLSRRYRAMQGGAGERWHIDLPACNRLQLLEAGVPPQHVQLSAIDTWQQSATFFSARRLGIHSGRIYSGIVLRPV